MTSTLITAYLGQGLAAARPATPAVAPGTIAYWYATDTGVLSIYANGAWSNVGIGAAGAPPTIVQSKMAVANSASITLNSAPINGNLLVAMTFNPTTGTVGTGWTSQAGNSTGTDFGLVATKVAGAGESATQSPINVAGNGLIMMWELSGQAVSNFVIGAALQVMQAGLVTAAPQLPNLKDCLCLGCVDLVSTSNSINALFNMTQDQIINTGTTRQGVAGHSDASTAIGSPVATFTGAGTPGNKCGIILIKH